MKAYLFPGQGSQAKGMGRDLFARHADWVALADRVLGYSVAELCLEDPRRELDRTQFTQPAIYVVNALAWRERSATEAPPDAVAGHSLGEYDALLAAGCFDFETGLRLVQERARLMGQAADGAMAAILQLGEEDIRAVLADNGLDQIDIANLNTPRQTVISGAREQIARAQDCFGNGRGMYIPLNTSGAFHSRFMAPARAAFERFLASFEFRAPRIPVIANVSAQPYGDAQVAALLGAQITSPVRWCDSILELMARGEARGTETRFIEVGHGEVLGRMLQKIRAELPRAAAAAKAPAAPPVRLEPEPPRATHPQDRIDDWNRRHPVGTRVRSAVLGGAIVPTRSPAQLLFQHRAAVYLEGFSGYFDLEELQPALTQEAVQS